jgi:hypothetical protein
MYKLVTMQMLEEAGITVWVNTFLAGARWPGVDIGKWLMGKEI